jgi:hypothetical protein
LPGRKEIPAEEYRLYTWEDLKDDSWNFRFVSAFVSVSRALNEVVVGDRVLHGLEQLQQAISKMKPGSKIWWSSDLEAYLTNGSRIPVQLRSPPDWLTQKVKRLTETQHVELSLIYCRCSP